MNTELELLKRIDERNYLTEREHKEFYGIVEKALIQAKKDKAEIEKLKHDNAILHIQLDTFKKIAFKNKGE